VKKAFFLLLLPVIFSCTSGKKELPEKILTHDQMVRTMIDVHILEAKIKKLYINADSSKKLYDHYETMLFDDLNIDRLDYENSIGYYANEITSYKNIYDEVVDSLLARQKTKDAK